MFDINAIIDRLMKGGKPSPVPSFDVDLRFVAALGSDVQPTGSVLAVGDVREFKIEMHGREYVCQQYRDGTTLMYRRGGLVAEIKTDKDGVTGINRGDVIEYYDRDGALFRRDYPDGIVEYYDGRGNLIGREDPHAGMTFVEKPAQRKNRKAWNRKLTVRVPKHVVPKGLGKIKDILNDASKKKLIVVEEASGKNKVVTSIALFGDGQPIAKVNVATTPVDVPRVLVDGASNLMPGILHVHDGDRAHIASSEDTPHLVSVKGRSQEYSEEHGGTSHDASTDMVMRSFVAPMSDAERFDDRNSDKASSSCTHGDVDEPRSKAVAASFDGRNIDGAPSGRKRIGESIADVGMRSALFVGEPPARRKDLGEEKRDPVTLSLYGCMTYRDSKHQADGREHLAEAPRYPSIPISGPIAPLYKMETKSERIIVDPSDPEQADYDQPQDDRQQHKHQDDDQQEEELA